MSRTIPVLTLTLAAALGACTAPGDEAIGPDAGADPVADPAAAPATDPAAPAPADAPALPHPVGSAPRPASIGPGRGQGRATVPNTTITGGPSGTVATPTAVFSFTASLTGSTFQCRLDGGAWTTCTSPRTHVVSEGTHTFRVRACKASCDATPATRTWTVDTTAPDTMFTSTPPAVIASTSATFAFTSPDPATFQCSRDGGAFAACTSPVSYTGLTSGTHTVRVRACDAIGNCDPTPASYSWTVDVTAPDTLFTSTPPTVTASTAATFAFTSPEPATFQCALDGAAFAACTSPTTLASLDAISHTYRVRACDPVGNCDPTPASYTWTIDTVAPIVTITSSPASPTSSTSATFAFVASEPASLQCALDLGAFVPCTSPVTYTSLGDGSHQFRVRACDAVGNCSAPATATWTVATTPLTLTVTSGPPEITEDHTAVFSFVANRPATFRCQLDSAGFTACTSPWTVSVSDGQHFVDIQACDGIGCTPLDQVATWSWFVQTIF